jgi:hypothetical protein
MAAGISSRVAEVRNESIRECLKNFRIYGDLLIDTEHVKVEKGFQRSPDEVVVMAKKIFNIR